MYLSSYVVLCSLSVVQRFNIPGFGPSSNVDLAKLQALLKPGPTATGWRVPAGVPIPSTHEGGDESSSEDRGGPSNDCVPASDHGSAAAPSKTKKLPQAKEAWLVSYHYLSHGNCYQILLYSMLLLRHYFSIHALELYYSWYKLCPFSIHAPSILPNTVSGS